MRCYRYLDYEFGVRSVLQAAFKVTSPDDFNDPFDCIGNACGVPPREVLCKYAASLSRPPGVTLEQTIDWLRSGFDCKMAASIQDRKSIGSLFRVLCLSDAERTDANSETLMWAHYADRGSGVRVVFEFESDQLPLGCAVEQISYAHDGKVPMLLLDTLTDFPMSPEIRDFYASCIVTKGPSWKYEKEVRLVVGPDAVPHLVRKISPTTNKVVELLPVPRECIKGLEFGYRVSEAAVNAAIRDLVAEARARISSATAPIFALARDGRLSGLELGG